MVVNALTSLLPLAWQKGHSLNRISPNPFSTGPIQADSPNISPAASFLSSLQRIQQQNPTLFKQITSRVATKLQSEAKRTAAQGNSTQAGQLNQLATAFQNSSTTGQIPSAQALQQAAFGAHHGYYHGAFHNDTQSVLNSILGSSISSTTAN
jgi:hypothetical protein